MVVRLSDIRAETGKKCFFCVFRLFFPLCQTASQPQMLSYINAFRINQSYLPKDQSVKFSRKNFENWGFWKTAILKIGHFENWPFWIFFFNFFFFFFASFSWKSVQISMVEWIGRNFDVFHGFQKISCYA